MKYPYLFDKDFLAEFDKQKLREELVRLTLLNFNDEKPIRNIIGKAINGSLTLDGSSNVRRTCNITILADEYENDLADLNRDISINKKFFLEIGVVNHTDEYTEYPVIWFPQGTFVMISASLTKNSGATTISIQAKDKMCLLNGECGGVLPAPIDGVNKADYIDENGNTVTKYITIYEIIKEMVHHWGQESLNRIVINDIDERVRQVKKWIGKNPLYIIHGNTSAEAQYSLTQPIAENITYTTYNYGDDVGYTYVDFTYPGELSTNAGETITSVLDKIKDALGNYEYFYDVYGNFIFQEKRNYLNTSFSTKMLKKVNNEPEGTPQAEEWRQLVEKTNSTSLNDLTPSAYISDMNGGKTMYKFGDGELIAAYTTTPQWNNIKNDFLIWGKRKSADGKDWPIRYHLSIDEKPKNFGTYWVFKHFDSLTKTYKANTGIFVDTQINEQPDPKICDNPNVFYITKLLDDNGNPDQKYYYKDTPIMYEPESEKNFDKEVAGKFYQEENGEKFYMSYQSVRRGFDTCIVNAENSIRNGWYYYDGFRNYYKQWGFINNTGLSNGLYYCINNKLYDINEVIFHTFIVDYADTLEIGLYECGKIKIKDNNNNDKDDDKDINLFKLFPSITQKEIGENNIPERTVIEAQGIKNEIFIGEAIQNFKFYDANYKIIPSFNDKGEITFSSYSQHIHQKEENQEDEEIFDYEEWTDSFYVFFDGEKVKKLNCIENKDKSNYSIVETEDNKEVTLYNGLYLLDVDNIFYYLEYEPNIITNIKPSKGTTYYYDLDSQKFFYENQNIWSIEYENQNNAEIEILEIDEIKKEKDYADAWYNYLINYPEYIAKQNFNDAQKNRESFEKAQTNFRKIYPYLGRVDTISNILSNNNDSPFNSVNIVESAFSKNDAIFAIETLKINIDNKNNMKKIINLLFLSEINNFSIKTVKKEEGKYYFDGKTFYLVGEKNKLTEISAKEIKNLTSMIKNEQIENSDNPELTDILQDTDKYPSSSYYFDGPNLYWLNGSQPYLDLKDVSNLISGKKDVYKIWKYQDGGYIEIDGSAIQITPNNWRSELYFDGIHNYPIGVDYNYYYEELDNEWPKLFDIFNTQGKDEPDYWNAVYNNLTGIDYYLDMIDAPSAEIGELSVNNIGRRTYVLNDDSINCIFEPPIPDYLIIEAGSEDASQQRQDAIDRKQNYVQVSKAIYKNLSVGGKYNSAFEQVRALLYTYTRFNESVNLTTIPIYHLEPNTLISVYDRECGIRGEYNIDSISIPLDVSGTMSISCSKALKGF